jgi:hypothetical protein
METTVIAIAATNVGDMIEFENGSGDKTFGVVVERLGNDRIVRFGSDEDDVSRVVNRVGRAGMVTVISR